MESWYFILGLLALAGLFWLASLSQTMLRLLMGAWGICMFVAGVGVLVGTIASLAEVPWSSTVGALQGLLLAVVGGGLGLGLLYAGYRMVGATLQGWD